MDLLLHLVKQQEVDIHDISISSILSDYLAHLDVLKAMDLSDIGDFVVVASALMEIKSRELGFEDVESWGHEEKERARDTIVDLVRTAVQFGYPGYKTTCGNEFFQENKHFNLLEVLELPYREALLAAAGVKPCE